MAAIKSLVSLSTIAALAIMVMGVAQVALSQEQSCTAELGNLNVCAPFVIPGQSGNPSSQCCSALQAVDHNCLCNTLRIAAQIPSRCNLPALVCDGN